MKKILLSLAMVLVLITPVAMYHHTKPTVVIQTVGKSIVKKSIKQPMKVDCAKVQEYLTYHLTEVQQRVSPKTLAAIKKQCNIKG